MIRTAQTDRVRYEVCCSTLPLAVYREVAAHLRQVTGVTTGLLPQLSSQFDYGQSQVGGLWIQFADSAGATARDRVDQILAYYGDRFGDWQLCP